MAPGSSTDRSRAAATTGTGLTAAQKSELTALARASIEYGLRSGKPLPVQSDDYPESMRNPGAAFVTLKRDGELRGCIGSITAARPLVEDVAHNAFAAAFQDPRFPPLQDVEFPDLEIHISVLTPARPMEFTSETDLLRQLRPGVDGLILGDGYRRGTFLPSVWESLPDPRDFLANLKLKAGLPRDYWSDSIEVQRYETEEW
jgi:AmmeMemoRadiSam system protein A